jgi:hypothetical protein
MHDGRGENLLMVLSILPLTFLPVTSSIYLLKQPYRRHHMADGKVAKTRAPQKRKPMFVLYRGDDVEIVNTSTDPLEVLKICQEDADIKYHMHDFNA